MRRRILLVIIGSLAVAFLATAVSAFTLLRRQDARAAVRALGQPVLAVAREERPTPEALELLKAANGLDGAAIMRLVPADDPPPSLLEAELEVGGYPTTEFLDVIAGDRLERLQAGELVDGTIGDVAYAAVANPASGNIQRVAIVTRPIESSAAATAALFAAASTAGVILASALAALLSRRLVAPLAAVETTTRRIAGGDLSARVIVPNHGPGGDDEIGALARSINTMAAELERARASERQFLLSVSHDLRTPLTSIRGFAEALSDGAAPDPARAAGVIAAEARRLERLVKDLLDLARLETRQFRLDVRAIDVGDVATDTADGFLPTADRAGVALELHSAEGLIAMADPDRLAQVLANLIENAMKYARTSVLVTAQPDVDGVVLSVRDDGPGIEPEDLPRIFDRLYTSDRHGAERVGTGLGLAIVRELVVAMDGRVEPTSSPAGTTIAVHLQGAPAPSAVTPTS